MKWQLFNFSESRICANIYGMFRSVHWTHDMIIVKRHLFIWHERKLCALTNAPPVQSTQTGQWLSTFFQANCSAAQVYVLYPRQFIFALSCRRHHFCRYYNPQSAGKVILKNFLCIWWWQMLWWKHACLNQKIIKNSNLLQTMKNSVVRKRKLSEGRIFPKAECVRIFFECSKVLIEHTTW